MPKRTTNRDCRDFVARMEPFDGSNLYARWVTDDLYVVWSWGDHWPLLAKFRHERTWMVNEDTYSRSTGRHLSQARPYGAPQRKTNTDDLLTLVETVKNGLRCAA